MKSRHWYQISVLDLIVIAAVAAIIVRLNFVGHDVGSGFSIIDYGIPFPILTDHSEFGRSVDGIALLIDVVLWIVTLVTVIIACRKLRISIVSNWESAGG